MKNIKPLLLSFAATLLLASCNTNNPTLPEPEIGAPQIADFGVLAADTTIKIGAEIKLSPKVITPTKADQKNSYSWMVDNKVVATTPDYKFTATAGGVSELRYTVSNSSGSASRTLRITAKVFLGNLLIVNEGWFGHDMGSINGYDPSVDTIETTIFQKVNSGKTIGAITASATLWGDNYYFVSKQGNRLVAANRYSFVQTGALENLGGDGRAFAGINASKGIVTTSAGAFEVNINPLSVGAVIAETKDGECGGVYATERYAFVINRDKGLQIFDIKDGYKLKSTTAGVSVGFAKSKDGLLWAAATDSLVSINIESLEIKSVKFPSGVKINPSWGAWNSGPLVASPKENVLYFTKSGTWGGGREVYRYVIGDITSLNSVFITSTVVDDNFYGSGIGVDPVSGDIVATFVRDGWGDSYQDNRLVFFDAKTGVEKRRIKYDGYWFPAMILFN